jgi:formamidopyrimidine-DNA glycosylase
MTLGQDALDADGGTLKSTLERSARPIKSALLDQASIAGIGNIYADESLFATGIHPLRQCKSLSERDFERLASNIRRILHNAVLAGGSTLRDYRDAFGELGNAVQTHQVYGHAGDPCPVCRTTLDGFQLGGRTTVACPRCQHLSTKPTR